MSIIADGETFNPALKCQQCGSGQSFSVAHMVDGYVPTPSDFIKIRGFEPVEKTRVGEPEEDGLYVVCLNCRAAHVRALHAPS